MASISSLGVGSGLDLSSILDSLTAAQKATLTPISNQQSSFTAKLSAYGTLKSALTTFQTANTALSKADRSFFRYQHHQQHHRVQCHHRG